ncbi:hypothetical protein [Erythrobacter sp. WG]|uniref:hypothetical protein n=1 Tax=Erythrobacter sp. WG TaxID=2985510 RepID=UPI00226D70D4|nr:hypothetical protein [Erythrobacter sp. WG]MCX9145795.1 hypothetical protein [Erythrobacter sp. WG]
MIWRSTPALASLLALASAVLPGCAGIIPAVAGETAPVSVEAPPRSVGASLAAAPSPEPSRPSREERSRTPAATPPAAVPVDAAVPAAQNASQDQPVPPPPGFARFLRFTLMAARDAKAGAALPSALLSDPIALDGRRRRCAVGEQLVAVIDLDPQGGVFAPPPVPVRAPALAAGLGELRAAGVELTWISDLSTDRSGALRTALEQSGLDPRGQDIISLRRDEGDTKDQRKSSLGGFACIVAIAGDERPDFDARFKYLRKPEAGVALEGLIGDGWFIVEPLVGN